jgi:hypothetical protein
LHTSQVASGRFRNDPMKMTDVRRYAPGSDFGILR